MKNSILLVHNYYRKRYRGGEDIVFDNEYSYLKERYPSRIFRYTADNDELRTLSGLTNLPYSNAHAYNVQSIVKRKYIDIVHFHNVFFNLSPSVIIAASNAGAKVIMTLHNYRWWCPNGALFNPSEMKYCERCTRRKYPSDAVRFRCLYDNYLISAAISFLTFANRRKSITDYIDKFIVLSENTKENICRFGIDRERITVKPNFSDLTGEYTKKRDILKEYLYIGRLDTYKGFDMLMRVWERSDYGNLTVIGNGPLLEKYSNELRNDKRVKFLGKCRRERVKDLLKESSFLIMPSLMNENFPLTLIEAMSFGLPVITTDIGMRSEVVNSKNGILYSPDEKSLNHALKESAGMSLEEYQTMSCQAYEDSKQYSEETVMNQLIDIYRDTA